MTKFWINSFHKSNQLRKSQINNSKHIKLFFENQMWYNYKIDEKQLTEIIKKNVKPVDTEFSIELIFFTNFDWRILLLKNNHHKPTCKYNVVYQYNDNKVECIHKHLLSTQNRL